MKIEVSKFVCFSKILIKNRFAYEFVFDLKNLFNLFRPRFDIQSKSDNHDIENLFFYEQIKKNVKHHHCSNQQPSNEFSKLINSSFDFSVQIEVYVDPLTRKSNPPIC